MKRGAVAVLALILLGSAVLSVVLGVGSAPAVYSVAEVRAGLAHKPRAWVGQTVLVRGVVVGGIGPLPWLRMSVLPVPALRPPALPVPALHPPALRVRLVRLLLPHIGGVLVDAGTQAPTAGLPLAFGPPNPVLAMLRRVPWLGRFAPQPQSLNMPGDRPAVYRVRLQAAPTGSCMQRPCYEALLLDSAPPPWLPVMAVAPGPVTLLRVPAPSAPVRIMPLRPLVTPAHGHSAGRQTVP